MKDHPTPDLTSLHVANGGAAKSIYNYFNTEAHNQSQLVLCLTFKCTKDTNSLTCLRTAQIPTNYIPRVYWLGHSSYFLRLPDDLSTSLKS